MRSRSLFNFKSNSLLYCVIFTVIALMPSRLGAQTGADSPLLSAGRWVKVHTDTTSVYRIHYAQLREWGFDNPDKIVVAGYGSVERAHSLATAPDDLPVLPVYRDKDAIYFYAEGDTRLTLTSTPGASSATPFSVHYNYYSKGSCYFIGERAGVASPDMPAGQMDETVSYTEVGTHYSIDHHLYRENHPTLHGMMSYSNEIGASSPRTVSFDISGHAGSGVLYYSYIWRHSQTTTQSIGLDFQDGVASYSGTIDRLSRNNTRDHWLYTRKENARMSLTLADGAERCTATVRNPNGVFENLALASHTFACCRRNIAQSGPSTLYLTLAPAHAALRMEGNVAGLVAWDVTNPRTPSRLDVRTDGDTYIYGDFAATSVKVYTFRPSAEIPVPEYVAEVPNQDLHNMDDADMLIFTTEATYTAAQRLAAAHEQWQGMKVNVIRQGEVFNEFSSGSLHPNAIRQLVRRMAARQRPVRYVLMFGAGSWDSRGTFDQSGMEYLAMYSTEDFTEACDETQLYSTDLYFGTFADRITTSLASLRAEAAVSVGRVPALDAAGAEAYVDKCITYLSDPVKAGHFNHAIIDGGLMDQSSHLMASENLGTIIDRLTIAPTINRAHLALFPLSNAQRMQSEMLYTYLDSRFGGNSRLFSYTGHSSIDAISHVSHTLTREAGMAYGSLPVVYMASCSTSPIDISDKNLGGTMVLHNPGPIVVIGAGNEVYLTYNVNLNKEFMERFYTQEGGECLGDVFRASVNALRSSTNQHINDLCYNFLGDPALPRYMPERTINVTSIGEVSDLTGEGTVKVGALHPTEIAGNVTRADGSVDTSFSGKLYLNIYNTPYTRQTLKHVSSDLVKDLVIDEDVIHSMVVNVEEGVWRAEVVLPKVNAEGVNRMTLNAVSDSRIIATGGSRCMSICDMEDGAADPDTTPPVIRLWLDTPDMADGAIVTGAPKLHIEITDSGSGTSLNGASIGMMPKVSYDGASLSNVPGLIHADGEGVVSGSYQFDNLADGPHTVTVYARDVAGNSTTESISFTVVNIDPTAALTVSAPIVRDDITFTLNHTLPGDVNSMRLIVRDMEGNTVLSADGVSFPYTWDFVGSDGFVVPDGTYRASVIINARPYYATTPETEFTLVARGQQ